jgi:glyoxylase-like metal-dependent hydrolase (beta-lactamase superfamily II)
MVIDTQATPVMAQDVIRRIREVTDKPIKYVVLTHYHAVRVLGASAYRRLGADHRQPGHLRPDRRARRAGHGQRDRPLPAPVPGVESVPGLTWPTITFTGKMTLWLGKLEVKMLQLGRGHTKGDTVVWLPQQNICFSGDLVEADARLLHRRRLPGRLAADAGQRWPP